MQNNCKIIEIGTFLKNRDPPLCFQNYQIEIGTFLDFFYTAPAPHWDMSQIFSLFYFDASPLQFSSELASFVASSQVICWTASNFLLCK